MVSYTQKAIYLHDLLSPGHGHVRSVRMSRDSTEIEVALFEIASLAHLRAILVCCSAARSGGTGGPVCLS